MDEEIQSAIYKCSNGICYNVMATPDVHAKLKEDSEFAEIYFSENLNNFEVVIDENELQQDDDSKSFVWTVDSTILLLDEYKKRRFLFRNPKQKKKLVWEEIVGVFLEKGYAVTYNILDRKFRNLKMTHKTITNNNKKRGGENLSKWPFYDTLTEILEGEDEDDDDLTHKVSKGSDDGKSSVWTGENVLLLLKEYTKRKKSFNDPSVQNRTLWEEIAKVFEEAGCKVNQNELITKFRNLKKTYNRIRCNNNENFNRRWAYYDIFDNIMRDDDKLTETLTKTDENLGFFGEIKENDVSFFWDHEKTLLLIKEYSKRKTKFFDPIKKKKLLWEEIVGVFKEHGYEVTPDMLDRKYRNMKATFLKIRQSEERNDNVIIKWPYYEHFKEIFYDDSSDVGCEISDVSVNNKIMFNDLTIFVPNLHADNTTDDKEMNFTWTYESVLLLLTEYNDRKALFKDPKTLKKTLWEEIVQVFKSSGLMVTADTLDRKFRNLKMSYKKAKTTPRRKEGKWQYYDLLDMIFSDEKTDMIELSEIGDIANITDGEIKFDADDPITYFVTDDIKPIMNMSDKDLVDSEELQGSNRQDFSVEMLEIERERVSSIKLLQKSLDEYNKLLRRQIEVADKRNKLLEQYIERIQ